MKSKILTVLCALFGLMFINAGLNKFFNYMPAPDNLPEATIKDFGALIEIAWLMPLIGIAEIVGGILVVIPKTRALAALILCPIMVGILLTHTLVDTNGLVIALVMWAIFIWILLDNKKKYAALF